MKCGIILLHCAALHALLVPNSGSRQNDLEERHGDSFNIEHQSVDRPIRPTDSRDVATKGTPEMTSHQTNDDQTLYTTKQNTGGHINEEITQYNQKDQVRQSSLLSNHPQYSYDYVIPPTSETNLLVHNHAQHWNQVLIREQNNQPCHCKYCDFGSVQNTSFHLVDVIFNKPGEAVAIAPSNPGPCGAVNGMRSSKAMQQQSTRPNCVETSFYIRQDANDHWVQYDMLNDYTIDKIKLWRRFNSEQNRFDTESFRAMSITLNGQLCFRFPGYDEIRDDSFLDGKVQTLKCIQPTTGRYIRFFKRRERSENPTNQIITICEIAIWVCDTGYYGDSDSGCKPCPSHVMCAYDICDNYYGCDNRGIRNVAMKKPAVMSSVQVGNPDNAVDGDLILSNSDSCSITNPVQDGHRNSWWRVDLENTFEILYVKLTNRLDCCGDRLKRFFIVVSRMLKSISHAIPDQGICYTFNGRIDTGATERLNCTTPLLGRYVSIVAHNPDILQFCEVQAFGYPVREIRPGKNCSILNNAAFCAPKTTCTSIKECKILEGGGCAGRRSGHCINGTICEKDVCVLAIGTSCDNSQVMCQAHSICDLQSGLKCKLNIGSVCQNDDSCTSDALCDPLKLCKLKINSSCKKMENHCRYQASCDAQSGFLCKFNPGADCIDDTSCKSGYVCDVFKKCKLALGEPCVQSDECIGGAACQNSICYCKATSDGTSCDPAEGHAGGPCRKGILCVTNSTCTDSICLCNPGHEASETNFTCKLSVGSTCPNTDACNVGLVCDNSTCKRKTGSKCMTSTECMSTDLCDNGICAIAPGGLCKQNQFLCSQGTLCEKGVCKIRLEQTCNQTNDQCTAVAMCTQKFNEPNSICRIKPGQKCKQKETLCVPTAFCESSALCKLKFGNTCTEFENDCQAHTKCDRGKCRYVLGHECSIDDDCETGTICDPLLLHCRLVVGQKCRGPIPRDMCTSGAVCDSAGNCACYGHGFSIQVHGRCDPGRKKIGALCDPTQASHIVCDDPLAQCSVDPKSMISKCKCKFGTEYERTNYTCGTGIGKSCMNTTVPCVSGLSCSFTGFCEALIGQSCEGERRNWCISGGICEDGICKADFNSDCSGINSNLCKTDTMCDTISRCKHPVKTSCIMSDTCVAGSKCMLSRCRCAQDISQTSGQTCVPVMGMTTGMCNSSSCYDPNAECSQGGICMCKEGFQVKPDLSCATGAGGACSSDSTCVTGTLCDKTKQKCVLKVGEFCGDGNENNCGTGTVCDINKECRHDFNGRCKGQDEFFCRIGYVCDWAGVCKRGNTQKCNDTSDCIFGAKCKNFYCECSKNESFSTGYICEPKPGFTGGYCDSFTKCKSNYSTCIDHECECQPGVPIALDGFFCNVTALGATNSANGGSLIPLIGLLVPAIVVGIFFVFLTARNQRQKKNTTCSMMSDMQSQMTDFNPPGQERKTTASTEEFGKNSTAKISRN